MAGPSRPKRARRGDVTRGVAVSIALGKLACSPAAPQTNVPPSVPAASVTAAPTSVATAEPAVTSEPAPAPVPDPSKALAPYTVTNSAYARRVLYTWTTLEQIDELQKTRVLLSRTESPKYGKSYYDRVIEQRWLGGDKVAGLLKAAAFAKARFAWPAPWATLLGWPGETYGRELLQVTLKPDAWIVMFRTGTQSWEVKDLQGATVPTDQLFKHPGRIAAVHFVHDAVSPPTGASSFVLPSAGDGREAFREYVLCNESMIESWSAGTDAITSEIAAGAALADSLADFFGAHPPPEQRADRWNAHVALLVWPTLVPLEAAKELYEAAIAFPNPNYEVDAAQLRKLAAAMRTLPQRAVNLTHQPTTKFTGAWPVALPPPPPPPRPGPIKKWRGTF